MRVHTTSLLPPWVRIVREPAVFAVGPKICSPADAARLLCARAATEEVEVFYALLLNAQNGTLAVQEVTRGVLTSAMVHPREVFRAAVAIGAAALIVLHNHPSGNPSPSADDRVVTAQLVAAGRLLDIPVHDHVILGEEAYFSFAEAGLL